MSSGNIFTVTGLSNAGDMRASSGLQSFMYLTPTIKQTSTAGYNGILLNVTETTLGSGENNLLDLQVGGTSKFSVGNGGEVIMPSLPTSDPTNAGELWNNSGVLTVSAG